MVDDVGYVTSLTPDELDFMSKWMAEAFESGKLISRPQKYLKLIYSCRRVRCRVAPKDCQH